MKSKKIWLSVGLLALASTGSNAATVYTLQYVRYDNSFAGNYHIAGIQPGGGSLTLAGSCAGCGVSTATDDGFGNISIVGASWGVGGAFGQGYSNSFSATTTVGLSTTLTKLPGNFCAQFLPAPATLTGFCAGNAAAAGGPVWYTGTQNDGITANPNIETNVYMPNSTELWVEHTMMLSEDPASSNTQTYTLVYSTVPVPAAVWLFGSSLGLLGFARRNRQAA